MVKMIKTKLKLLKLIFKISLKIIQIPRTSELTLMPTIKPLFLLFLANLMQFSVSRIKNKM